MMAAGLGTPAEGADGILDTQTPFLGAAGLCVGPLTALALGAAALAYRSHGKLNTQSPEVKTRLQSILARAVVGEAAFQAYRAVDANNGASAVQKRISDEMEKITASMMPTVEKVPVQVTMPVVEAALRITLDSIDRAEQYKQWGEGEPSKNRYPPTGADAEFKNAAKGFWKALLAPAVVFPGSDRSAVKGTGKIIQQAAEAGEPRLSSAARVLSALKASVEADSDDESEDEEEAADDDDAPESIDTHLRSAIMRAVLGESALQAFNNVLSEEELTHGYIDFTSLALQRISGPVFETSRGVIKAVGPIVKILMASED